MSCSETASFATFIWHTHSTLLGKCALSKAAIFIPSSLLGERLMATSLLTGPISIVKTLPLTNTWVPNTAELPNTIWFSSPIALGVSTCCQLARVSSTFNVSMFKLCLSSCAKPAALVCFKLAMPH